ncbi:MAG: hypothetical protein LBM38_04245 [Clostridiales bacterium]|jgi:hypothetical protein|nr:hypothetical protein [Clostridiales bacterium]
MFKKLTSAVNSLNDYTYTILNIGLVTSCCVIIIAMFFNFNVTKLVDIIFVKDVIELGKALFMETVLFAIIGGIIVARRTKE